MATNLEIEFKNMLTEVEYNRLLQEFDINEEQIWLQKNVYFDTKNSDLKHKEAALRVRVKNNTYELTLKTKKEIGLLETNQSITKTEYKALKYDQIFVKGPILDALLELGIDVNHLHVITDLATKRAEVAYEGGVLVLDKSFYGEIIDYELEYEVSDFEDGNIELNVVPLKIKLDARWKRCHNNKKTSINASFFVD